MIHCWYAEKALEMLQRKRFALLQGGAHDAPNKDFQPDLEIPYKDRKIDLSLFCVWDPNVQDGICGGPTSGRE